MFEGVRGASFRGDISVDDIELTDGSCASSGKNVKNARCNENRYNYMSGLSLRCDSTVALILTPVTNLLLCG